MEIDVPESSNRRFNRMVATTVVMLSVAMALGNIKDGNIVQAMQADTATKIDSWNEYQATRIKLHVDEAAAASLAVAGTPAAQAAATSRSDEIARYDRESKALKAQALAADADYDRQGYRDDQFDLAEGFSSIALAVAAIAALTEGLPLLIFAWVAAGFGLAFEISGFASLPLHPGALVDFLT